MDTPSSRVLSEVAGKIPLDRLLLETDAPYFLPECEWRRNRSGEDRATASTSSPAHVAHVLAMVKEQGRRTGEHPAQYVLLKCGDVLFEFIVKFSSLL